MYPHIRLLRSVLLGFLALRSTMCLSGYTHGSAQCPVLLTPQFTIKETLADAPPRAIDQVIQTQKIRQWMHKVWRTFQTSAVACFGFVGPVGILYLKNLISHTFTWNTPTPAPAQFGLDHDHSTPTQANTRTRRTVYATRRNDPRTADRRSGRRASCHVTRR
jgi:uncharacterized protein YbcC (UPF0753/DUF2309 family)